MKPKGSEVMGGHLLLTPHHRRRHPELMDQPDLDGTEHSRALTGLGRINRVSRSAAIYWPELASLAQAEPGRPVRVLDIATGGGDDPIALARRAIRSGLNFSIDGCDKSPRAIEFATQQATARGLSLHFFALDALIDDIPSGFDALVSSLFLHHLNEREAITLLGRMASATTKLIMINDLLRGPFEYALAWTACRLLSRSKIVRHDGPVSVRAAFTMSEVRDLANQAGLKGAKLARRWPGRFLLSWSRP
jgi:SAM-dependent methyltransferase